MSSRHNSKLNLYVYLREGFRPAVVPTPPQSPNGETVPQSAPHKQILCSWRCSAAAVLAGGSPRLCGRSPSILRRGRRGPQSLTEARTDRDRHGAVQESRATRASSSRTRRRCCGYASVLLTCRRMPASPQLGQHMCAPARMSPLRDFHAQQRRARQPQRVVTASQVRTSGAPTAAFGPVNCIRHGSALDTASFEQYEEFRLLRATS